MKFQLHKNNLYAPPPKTHESHIPITSAWPQPRVYCHWDLQMSKALQLHTTSQCSGTFHWKLLSVFSNVKIRKVNRPGCFNANVTLLDFSAPTTLTVTLENGNSAFHQNARTVAAQKVTDSV